MKILLLVVSVVASACATENYYADGPWNGGVRCTFGFGLSAGKSYLFDLPRNTTEAATAGFLEVTPPARANSPISLLSMRCVEYYNLCLLFDDTGYIAGVQIAFVKKNLTNTLFDITEGSYYVSWTPVAGGDEYWASHMFFASADFLATSSSARIAARNPVKILQDEGIWVPNYEGSLLYIPKNVTKLESENVFTEQACVPWMGRHRYYNMSSSTECTSKANPPIFTLQDSDEIVGYAWYIIGSANVTSGAKDYFEKPTRGVVEYIVPNGPEWFYDAAETNGMTTLHFYVINEPWLITCIGQ